MNERAKPSGSLEVAILIGLPGSGKSTFARETLARTHVIISKDLMKNRKKKEERQRRLLRDALTAGRSVVVDNTNVSREVRASIIEIAREYDARVVAFYFPITVAESLQKNQGPGRIVVPPVAIFSAAKKLEEPTIDEGFQEINMIDSKREPNKKPNGNSNRTSNRTSNTIDRTIRARRPLAPIWRYDSRFARLIGVDAIVLFPFILTRFEPGAVTDRLRAHELEHIEQIRQLGVARFYLRYFFYYLIGLARFRNHVKAYWFHPYEVAAREAEGKPIA